MSPRAKNFNSGSIIYFEGDRADSVFLLKQGIINLIYDDITGNEKIVDKISAGEFFGVKSGLIRYPREETARALNNSVVFEFSATEFESLVMKNTKIILKMLKVFSNQLRKVGKQIQSIVGKQVTNDPSDELFNIGEYYLRNKKYKQAITVYQRYVKYYPNGKYSLLGKKRLELAKEALSSYGEGGGPAPIFHENCAALETNSSELSNESESVMDEIEFDEDKDSTEESKIYYKGISYMSQSKYLDAFNTFKIILTMKNEEEKIMASVEIGKCFFFLKKFKESINHLSNFLVKHPDYYEREEILYYIGSSYSKIGDKSEAKKIFENILSTAIEGDSIYRKAKKSLKELR